MHEPATASSLPPVPRDGLWTRRLDLERQHGLCAGREEDQRNWRKSITVWGIRTILKSAGLYARGLQNALQPQLRRIDITLPRMSPTFDGLRVLHLSDFHFRRSDSAFADAIAACLSGIETDLCLLTGDYRFGYYGPVDHIEPFLQRILAGIHAPFGCYGVFGNHDVSPMLDLLNKVGVHMLINEGAAVAARGLKIWIGGVDDPHKFRCDDVDKALAGAPEGALRILLAHSPESILAAAERDVDLYLCGHTHAGQIRFPLVGAIETNARRAPRVCVQGRWAINGTEGYTSWGLGTTDLPVRYNCPPEAVLITLRAPRSA